MWREGWEWDRSGGWSREGNGDYGWGEVEYKTEKRGKKLEAVMVRSGLVTHWVLEELAGVIRSEEVLVYRREFVPGGFDSDIVGKSVKFKLD